ncbi:heparan sulfate glucosamine 3-O-sulfotransferase 6-like [Apostichopus japonicus]|uniref:heparan sulfate glucosamine 3-O-sulfotransferase 6-like n=1 Tax=Stichopus japonicus TaxID=307972 RepID=UPI003AB2CD50
MARHFLVNESRRNFIYCLLFAIAAGLLTWYEMATKNTPCTTCFKKLPEANILRRKVTSGVLNSKSLQSKQSLQGLQSLQSKWNIEGCYVYTKGRLALSRSEIDNSLQNQLNCTKRKPSVIIMGIKKCGTETLTGMLDLHPNVVTSMYPVQDGCCMDLNSRTFGRVTPLTVPGEIGLLNMIGLQYAPENISRVLELLSENPKFIVIMKDPLKRALSDYSHVTVKMKSHKNQGLITSKKEMIWNYNLNKPGRQAEKVSYFKGYRIAASFEKSVFNVSGGVDGSSKLISLGLYDNYVVSILDHIQRESVLFIDGGTFMEKPWVVLKDIESFLGVPSFFTEKYFRKEKGYYCPIVKNRPDSGCLKGKGRKKPYMDKNAIKTLINFYRRRYKPLVELTGITFSWM